MLAVLAVALAGCGSSGPSPSEKYAAAVNTATTTFGTQIIAASQRVTPDSDKAADGDALTQEADAFRHLGDALGKIKAPDSVNGQHAQLRTEVADFANTLANADPADPKALQQSTDLAVGRIKATITSINGSL